MNLSTSYMGLTLKNPIIAGSCGLTRTVDQIKACEDANAGAVVMKSLFEEQIREQDAELEQSLAMHPEALEYLRADIDMRYGADAYTEAIAKAKQAVSIPVLASVNCYTSKWWMDYAKKIQEAGADALEMNIFVMPADFTKSAADIEAVYVDILKAVKAQISIPVALKLSPMFTSFGNFALRLERAGVDGLVLFNRFVQPDIDISSLQTTMTPSFNDPAGFGRSLGWIGLLSGQLDVDLVASGGIRDSLGVAKQLLAGAVAVQVASALYAKGLGKIQELLNGLEEWMEDKNFATLDEFCGNLNHINSPRPETYVRAQYLKAYTNVE
ncbi:dihydroorotate dehydrogenase [Candidatus Moduliflexus flocculans]|uniref:Dihydroorotate dehydrogenase n=1 Tax=Candidatus Moduliflexus flocculans TaxID=1499966 RepID=A0A0S6VY12_9BACT|nr:dihydroorotate dehydrogenase [Candidatus Moduliflexus flocculans]